MIIDTLLTAYTLMSGVSDLKSQFMKKDVNITRCTSADGLLGYISGTIFEDYYVDYTKKVYQLTSHHCPVSSIPDNIFSMYPNIIHVDISETGLESIDEIKSLPFDKAPNFRMMTAAHNQITEIPYSAFSFIKNVTALDFSHNKIQRIDALAFDIGNKIENLDLSSNLLHKVDLRSFLSLDNLVELDLSDNAIDKFDAEIFSNLAKLQVLSLRGNQIKQIECGLFANLGDLIALDVSDNELTTFDGKCIRSVKQYNLTIDDNQLESLTLYPNMKSVNAARNQIKWILIDGDVSEIVNFNVTNNHIENIAVVLQKLSSALQVLDVSHNFVGKLTINTFAKFENLERLGLRATKLSNIQFGTFQRKQNLKLLDIGFNELDNLNFNALNKDMPALNVFYLDGNRLTEMDGLKDFSNLDFVCVTKNHFQCEYILDFLSHYYPFYFITMPTDETNIAGIQCTGETPRIAADEQYEAIADADNLQSSKSHAQLSEQPAEQVIELSNAKLKEEVDEIHKSQTSVVSYVIVLSIGIFFIILTIIGAIAFFVVYRMTSCFNTLVNDNRRTPTTHDNKTRYEAAKTEEYIA